MKITLMITNNNYTVGTPRIRIQVSCLEDDVLVKEHDNYYTFI